MMALPAIRDVRRHFSADTLTVAARASVAPVFRAVPGVDRIIVLDRGREAAQLKGDVGILFPNSFRSAWILKRSGVKATLGLSQRFSIDAAHESRAAAARQGQFSRNITRRWCEVLG